MNTDSNLIISNEIPSPTEYCDLRKSSGRSPMTLTAAELGLPRSIFSTTVRNQGELVGMGRVVGDGLHVQIVDIAVHPDFQKRGLSRTIMENIMHYIDSTLPSSSVVSLLADVDWLYQKFGFREPSKSVGMITVGLSDT